ATAISSTSGPPPARCRCIRLPSTSARGSVVECHGSGAGEGLCRASLSVTTRPKTDQRRGHRYSDFSSAPQRNIDYRDQIVLDYRARSQVYLWNWAHEVRRLQSFGKQATGYHGMDFLFTP